MSGTTYGLTLIFKCRRCHGGDVVFRWHPNAAGFPLEARCAGCRAPHRLTVEAIEATDASDGT